MSATIASRNCTRIIALLLTLLVFFTATKIRAAEISRSDEELRMCQCDTDSVAAVGHQFVLQNNDTVAYLLPLSREVRKQLPLTLNPTYRGPPALF
ncbi:MAG: hypothetical protein ABSC55_08600 [Syntrophorhabdales bacterium]|jgi:hypothetical protein